jgi:predicted N-acetyltransferase YhbS
MKFSTDYHSHMRQITDLFGSSFSASEGPEEGRIIEKLATDLIATTPEDDMYVFSAWEDDTIKGAIIFTRMLYPQDDRAVFLLSPVAVTTAEQGKGVGQKLIRHGLDTLRAAGVDTVLTYGDINFYSKVGFAQITPAEAQPPAPLSYPHGWLGQSLSSAAFVPLKGPSTCAAALSDPAFW